MKYPPVFEIFLSTAYNGVAPQKGSENMSNKEEIALKITLAMIEKSAATYLEGSPTPNEYGKAAADLYNSVLHNIDARD